ncbi:MAG TPA: thioredoxin [Anaerolineaceae bacterium]|nr:thioredoxin [Anaerolineaceae bacterium]
MASEYIIDVNEADFEYEVVGYSKNVPVIVDFWAKWCVPCKTLSPALEKMVEEANGAVRLAKVDVDQNPNLAMRFGVRSIPSVKAFSQGQVVAEFTGLQPEPFLREFFEKVVPSPAGLLLEKGNNLLLLHQWSDAEETFCELLDENPDLPVAQLGLAKSLLGQGSGNEALFILRKFPPSREYAQAENLRPLAEAMAAYENDKPETDDAYGPAFRNAIRLAMRGNIPAALDGLLDILRQEKRYRGGLARMVILGLLDLLGEEDPQTREYRAELASILF